MGGCSYHRLWLLLWALILLQTNQSWGWFFSSKETISSKNLPENLMISGDVVAEFSMEPLSNPKGMELVKKAHRKVVDASNTCAQNAYQNLFAGCSEILPVEEKRIRFAWHLSDCFQKNSGRPSFPYCDAKSSMVDCLKKLDENAHQVYLQFYLETSSICHQLQADAFKRQTERLVNELKTSAENAEEKIGNIEEKAGYLIQSSNQVHESLSSIDSRTQKVAQTSKNVEDHVSTVLKHSEAIYEQSQGLAASQLKLREGQAQMKEKLEEGMTMLHDSYNNLGEEINNLRNEAVEIEKEIGKVGEEMSSKMTTLQIKAEDVENITGVSLEKQNQLLDGQSAAIEGLKFLTTFQSQALEESRRTLQQLAEFGEKQQEQLIQRQEQLEQAHNHLVENSKNILAAQEAFESKQASMFLAIDKLFTLHNAILLESRLMKAFFVYSISIFILYMLTSTKQTYSIRPRLYIGLFLTFLIEFALLRHAANDIEQQEWIIYLVRLLFWLLGSAQILYAIYAYRDYEVLNHHILLKLIEKVSSIQNSEWDVDSDVHWSEWVDTELPEDVNTLEDPDYTPPEEVGENSLTTSSTIGRYNLRKRLQQR